MSRHVMPVTAAEAAPAAGVAVRDKPGAHEHKIAIAPLFVELLARAGRKALSRMRRSE
ncbi:hypothetical protein J7I98_19415 [Streptomyces sp. ISL-98]|uniref:hypothetical protein n=1 Tax=Streptomyces sp. ISL-98 TaxID=2819192 RepID=UPI001BEA5097|nr:hypothetical protein [Streptomyces sp. ISL-98]MBT2508015.1 hypothetical protein [Streptomyces sp. ISL-98]